MKVFYKPELEPKSMFKKRIVSMTDIVESLNHIIARCILQNPKLKVQFLVIYNISLYFVLQVVLTVSPIRHTKEGIPENQRSKAHLISAVHELVSLNPNSVYYFPSYEIMIDELR